MSLCPFFAFLFEQPVDCASRNRERRVAHHCPLPNVVFEAFCAAERWLSLQEAGSKAVNLAVLALSTGMPAICPKPLNLATCLSSMHKKIVSLTLVMWEIVVMFALRRSMRRTAARAETLDAMLDSLHVQAESFLPDSYASGEQSSVEFFFCS